MHAKYERAATGSANRLVSSSMPCSTPQAPEQTVIGVMVAAFYVALLRCAGMGAGAIWICLHLGVMRI